jgi:pullulanase
MRSVCLFGTIVLCSLQSTFANILLEDCNSRQFQRVLHPSPSKAIDARAIWFSSAIVRWPGVAANDHFRIYFSERGQIISNIGEKVRGADGSVSLRVSDTMRSAALAERFKYVNAGATLELTSVGAKQRRLLHRKQLLLVRESASGRALDSTALQSPGALDDLYAEASSIDDLGVSLNLQIAKFKLWAPTAQRVSLCIYKDGLAQAKRIEPLKLDIASGVWVADVAANLAGYYYVYLVDVHVNGVGVVRNRVTDPYSISLSTDSKRSYIANIDDTHLQPAGWSEHKLNNRVKHATDMTIYELHVRDFSMNDATVAASQRGKYAAFTELHSNGMKHLRALSDAGLTDVHLLPVFDFATVPESNCTSPAISGNTNGESQQAAIIASKHTDCYNWGYDPYHFNAPEGSYSSDAMKAAKRIVEFREMVLALNAIGLRVGMDVVYNHTAASGQREKSVLDRIVPGYYHRLNAEGKVETSTCCDNTATEHMMMAKLMSDSVILWAKHYRIDSFRFDLMGHQPRAVMEKLKARLKAETGRDIQLIGEGWNFGEVENGKRFVQASQLSLNGSGIGTFSDRGRDAARGGGYGDNAEALVTNQGYLNGLVSDPNSIAARDRSNADLLRIADMIRVGLAGSIRGYTMRNYRDELIPLKKIDYNGAPAGYVTQPDEVVNYVENHDNETLFDINAYKLPLDTSGEDRARMQILGVALTAFSQGIPYFHAGIDTLRSKSMDRNSYDSGDWFNRLDWTYQDNYFATGLPRKDDNGANWTVIAERLANPAIKPLPAHIAWTRDAFRDLLRIRASSSLFRLRTADDVKQRLRFYNRGAKQTATVVVAHLNGTDYPDAAFRDVVYLINVDKLPQSVTTPELVGLPLTLHPVHKFGADKRARTDATFDMTTGRFSVPSRSAIVFVRK